MKGLIPQPFIEDLVSRVSVAEVVRSRIQLKKSGKAFTACCPFHQEKTPSFHVNTQKNYYHCFGCGAHGDSIDFLRNYENLSFNDAIEELAKLAGVEVPRDEKLQQAFSHKQKLLDAINFADQRYRHLLKTHSTRELATLYLQQRGLSQEIIEQYGLGFAPAERDALSKAATPEQLRDLIKTRVVSDKFGRPADLFQNRIMFPIRDQRGRTIAFGGRTLGDDKAKYINSPESEVFHKSRELYGYYEANKALRQIDRLLVVEGYMDVIALAQYGIHYAVATLGTATNADNIQNLISKCNHIIFCFDGDNAGLRAAEKAMNNTLPLLTDGLQVSFLLLPEGEDPDTLIRQEGQQQFEARIDRALPLSSFLFQLHSEGIDLKIPEHRGIFKQKVEQAINQIQSTVIKSGLRQQLNDKLYSRPRFKKDNVQPRSPQAGTAQSSEVVQNRYVRDPDITLCLALYYHPGHADEFMQNLIQLKAQHSFSHTAALSELIIENSIASTKDLIFYLVTHSEPRNAFYNLFSKIELLPDPEVVLKEARELLENRSRSSEKQSALEIMRGKSPSELSAEERKAVLAALSRSTPSS